MFVDSVVQSLHMKSTELDGNANKHYATYIYYCTVVEFYYNLQLHTYIPNCYFVVQTPRCYVFFVSLTFYISFSFYSTTRPILVHSQTYVHTSIRECACVFVSIIYEQKIQF